MHLFGVMHFGLKISEILPKVARIFLRSVFMLLQSLVGGADKKSIPFFVATSNISPEDREDLRKRLAYYAPVIDAKILDESAKANLQVILSNAPIMVFGPRTKYLNWLVAHRPGTFDIDFRRNPQDGWAWTGLADYLDAEVADLSGAQLRLKKRISFLEKMNWSKCYVFGTGPTLEKAGEHDWSNGYRVVCNTIVKDPILWRHIAPHFIVAGDAIYHFGHTEFARAFRRDLRDRLIESETLFVYPSQFHAIVSRELREFDERLIPIPPGWQRTINIDLTRSFRLPNLGNVLGLLLLPLACTLSKCIYLYGFDGRGPTDKLFWSNSNKHTYPEYMDDLKQAHPRFFEYYVPALDPNKYVREYQGDQLHWALEHAEKHGWTFEMLHHSWTPALQKRYRGVK